MTPFFDTSGITRRQCLAIGGLAALAPAALGGAARGFGRAKAVIVVFLSGGAPQHDMWDPKPDAPEEIRGETVPIATALPGLFVGDQMPRTARVADRLCVLRAMATFDNAHSSSGYYMLTAHPHQPLSFENARPGAPNNAPYLASVIKTLRPAGPVGGAGQLPTTVMLPERFANTGNIPWPGQDGGTLGRAADPWLLTCDPAAPNFQAPELALAGETPAPRLDARRTLLEQVNRHSSLGDSRYEFQREQAYALLRTPAVRRAFDLNQESASVRDRYGRLKFGQSVLLARRLVEAGVPFVQVNFPRQGTDLNNSDDQLWDTHRRHYQDFRRILMPQFDAAYPALISDLHERGLLDETLVVLMSEFGRTPRLNASAGRDHWGPVFSIALAGGGVRGGQVVGSSDRVGAYPRDGRVTPQDLHATILHCLGIGGDETFRDLQGRVLHASRGTVIPQVI